MQTNVWDRCTFGTLPAFSWSICTLLVLLIKSLSYKLQTRIEPAVHSDCTHTRHQISDINCTALYCIGLRRGFLCSNSVMLRIRRVRDDWACRKVEFRPWGYPRLVLQQETNSEEYNKKTERPSISKLVTWSSGSNGRRPATASLLTSFVGICLQFSFADWKLHRFSFIY